MEHEPRELLTEENASKLYTGSDAVEQPDSNRRESDSVDTTDKNLADHMDTVPNLAIHESDCGISEETSPRPHNPCRPSQKEPKGYPFVYGGSAPQEQMYGRTYFPQHENRTPNQSAYGTASQPYGGHSQVPQEAFGRVGNPLPPQQMQQQPQWNPYAPGYYQAPLNGTPYGGNQQPYYGGYSVPVAPNMTFPPIPVEKKNTKGIASLLFGIAAMAIVNYFPFLGFVLGIIALCMGFSALKQGRLKVGGKICAIIGLIFGMFTIILSVTMLTILFTRLFQAMSKGMSYTNSIPG